MVQNTPQTASIFRTVILFLLLIPIALTGQTKNGWTIMHYAVGSNSSEIDLLSDVQEMMVGKQSEGYEILLLIDRTPGFSEDAVVLGSNFTDTRLYRIIPNGYEELEGKEFLPELSVNSTYDANMGDADVLKRFVQYGKKYYPADHYMLVLRSHGNGTGMCPDPEGGKADKLYPGELRDVLSAEESVDILGLDVCSMAGLENLYEWRPDAGGFGADYVLASAPLSAAWSYDTIFSRLQTESEASTSGESNYFASGEEVNLDPLKMTPKTFSELLIEEIYDSQRWSSWGLFDNTEITGVKQAIDALAQAMTKEDKATLITHIEQALGYHHNTHENLEVAQLAFPYVDAYDFFARIAKDSGLSETIRDCATLVCDGLQKLVMSSYYGQGYLPETNDFVEGGSGVYLILPMGHKIFSQSKQSFWTHMDWYHPEDKQDLGNAYGNYDWCSDGAIPRNNKVETFYELLDWLFDTNNDSNGGVNGYRW